MLKKEQAEKSYNKAEVNRQLREEALSGRNKQSIEFRMANISAVLIDLCYPIINGYKPRGNVGADVGKRIRDIIGQEELLDLEDCSPASDESILNQRVTRLLKRGITGKPKGHHFPSAKTSSHSVYYRDPMVKAWVLDNAKGTCELCGELGPFIDKTGNYFLEEHHVIPLAERGSDTVENAVALCPNCHRKCHLGQDIDSTRIELQEKVGRIISIDYTN